MNGPQTAQRQMELQTSTRDFGRTPTGVREVNAILRGLHGQVQNPSERMNDLAPFPTCLGSIRLERVMDLSMSARTSLASATCRSRPNVTVRFRYATQASRQAVADFYLDEFRSNGLAAVERNESPEPFHHVVEGVLRLNPEMTCRISIDDYESFRSVKVGVQYVLADPSSILGRFAHWHGGVAPVAGTGAELTSVEITTFDDGPSRPTIVLYTSSYQVNGAAPVAVRPVIDQNLAEHGWHTHEARDGILHLAGAFDAEAHVLASDTGTGTDIDFVGEFHLCT